MNVTVAPIVGTFVSVNPQKDCHAIACWIQGTLSSARVVPNNPEALLINDKFAQVVIELPQVYVASKLKGDPNDLVDVAFSAGMIAAKFPFVRTLRPSEWKGGVPKKRPRGVEYVVARRVKKRIPDAEKLMMMPSTQKLRDDLWDAIAIGLFHLGRWS